MPERSIVLWDCVSGIAVSRMTLSQRSTFLEPCCRPQCSWLISHISTISLRYLKFLHPALQACPVDRIMLRTNSPPPYP